LDRTEELRQRRKRRPAPQTLGRPWNGERDQGPL